MSKKLILFYKVLIIWDLLNVVEVLSSGSGNGNGDMFVDIEFSGDLPNNRDYTDVYVDRNAEIEELNINVKNLESKLLEISKTLYINQKNTGNLQQMQVLDKTLQKIELMLNNMAIVMEKNQRDIQNLQLSISAKETTRHHNGVPEVVCNDVSYSNEHSGIKVPSNVLELKCSGNQLPQSCQDVTECFSNVFKIANHGFNDNKPYSVACDLNTDDGGWTIIQRRDKGLMDFNQNWTSYVEGFGELNGDFFIGLETLHYLTTAKGPQELYIILRDFDGVERFAKYSDFSIGSSNDDYRLLIDGYSGDAGDSLGSNNGYPFSTWDHGADNCPKRLKGGWWFYSCDDSSFSNLNGPYLKGKNRLKKGIMWSTFRDEYYSLKFVQMMIRPRNY
ncbi:fibrinogen-like protein 1 [Musca autumnalis]|uniref:fibrinogen-like protein 1 n=1 Tax=Musca autumnalis TaxID=221902 RepID=UPI003CE684D6